MNRLGAVKWGVTKLHCPHWPCTHTCKTWEALTQHVREGYHTFPESRVVPVAKVASVLPG